MTQTIQFLAASSQSTLVAKLYATGATNPATVVATPSAIVEVAKGVYVATFDGVAAASYVLGITDYTTEGVAAWMVDITASSGHFLSYEFGGSPASGVSE